MKILRPEKLQPNQSINVICIDHRGKELRFRQISNPRLNPNELNLSPNVLNIEIADTREIDALIEMLTACRDKFNEGIGGWIEDQNKKTETAMSKEFYESIENALRRHMKGRDKNV